MTMATGKQGIIGLVYAAIAVGLMATLGMVSFGTRAVAAEQRVAVFPFELLDASQDDELIPKIRPEETQRLELLTNDLKTRLSANPTYTIANLDGVAADVKASAPLYKCNGCEGDLAKKAGADVAMLGLVQKFSDTLLSVSIEVVDASTGRVTGSYTAGVQGNTDDAWLHALRHIVKNKIVVEAVSIGTKTP